MFKSFPLLKYSPAPVTAENDNKIFFSIFSYFKEYFIVIITQNLEVKYNNITLF